MHDYYVARVRAVLDSMLPPRLPGGGLWESCPPLPSRRAVEAGGLAPYRHIWRQSGCPTVIQIDWTLFCSKPSSTGEHRLSCSAALDVREIQGMDFEALRALVRVRCQLALLDAIDIAQKRKEADDA